MRSCQSLRNSESGCGTSRLIWKNASSAARACSSTDTFRLMHSRYSASPSGCATGADGADFLAIPVELFVGPRVGTVEQVPQFVIDRRVIAQFALGEIVGDVHDGLAAQVMNDGFCVRVQQQCDAVGDCLVVFGVIFCR